MNNLPKYMEFLYSNKFAPELIKCRNCDNDETIELNSIRKMARKCITIFKQHHQFENSEMFNNIFKTIGWYNFVLDSQKNIVKSWFGNVNSYSYHDLSALIIFHCINNLSFKHIDKETKIQFLNDNEINKTFILNKIKVSKWEINNNINKYFDLIIMTYINKEIQTILRQWKKKNWFDKLSLK